MRLRLWFSVAALAAMTVLAACAPPPEPPPPPAPTIGIDQRFALFGSSPTYTTVERRCDFNSPELPFKAGQTFTPARGGPLSRASLVLRKNGNAPSLRISVQTTTGAQNSGLPVPDGTILASITYSGSGSPNDTTFTDIEFPTPATLVAGQLYALVVETTACTSPLGDNTWKVVGSDSFGDVGYSRGGGGVLQSLFGQLGSWYVPPSSSGNAFDHHFRTYSPPTAGVDQDNPPTGEFSGDSPVANPCAFIGAEAPTKAAQTFVPGRSGNLDKVSLVVARVGQPAALRVTVQGLAAGIPDGVVLAESTYAGPGSPDDQTMFDVSFPVAATLTAGQTYVLVLETAGCASPLQVNEWRVEAGFEGYAAGRGGVFGIPPITGWGFAGDPNLSNFDLLFRTWMS